MPTVLLLDVSLSMSRPVTLADVAPSEDYQHRHIAIHGINSFLDYLTNHYKLEFVSLIAFSYLWEQLVAFTRDYESIKAALNKVEAFSKTCVETALSGIRTIICDEWSTASCQVILVTDGNLGIGAGSLKKSLQTYDSRQSNEEKFPLPFPFPCKLHVVCIGNPNSPEVRASLPYYQQLIDIGGQGGDLVTLDGPLSFRTAADCFQRLAEKNYSPFCGELHCGNFSCPIQLFPKPEPYVRPVEDRDEPYEARSVGDKIDIIGFLDIKDVGSPPTIARHLILPIPTKDKQSHDANGKDTKDSKAGKPEGEEEEGLDDGRNPSFTVLLHGSLKVQSMVAIATVQAGWYAMIYSWADSKKKSSLILALFTPGQSAVQWLGQFDHLTSCKDFLPDKLYCEEERKSPFPVRPSDKRSYSQSSVVWIKASGLQSDIQKVLRHARKLPDKLQQFYKELNRTRRAALSFGFLNLLSAMADMLDRECTFLPQSAHPNAAFQLNHAATSLRSETALNPAHNIVPFQTNFQPQGASTSDR